MRLKKAIKNFITNKVSKDEDIKEEIVKKEFVKNTSERTFNFSFGHFTPGNTIPVNQEIAKLLIKSYPNEFIYIKNTQAEKPKKPKGGGSEKCQK